MNRNDYPNFIEYFLKYRFFFFHLDALITGFNFVLFLEPDSSETVVLSVFLKGNFPPSELEGNCVVSCSAPTGEPLKISNYTENFKFTFLRYFFTCFLSSFF